MAGISETDLKVSDNIISMRDTKLLTLRQEGHLCDVVVLVNNANNDWVDFSAHKVVLVATSPYFHSLYEKGQLFDVVKMPTFVNNVTFSIMLNLLYGDPLIKEVVEKSSTNFSSFLQDLSNLALLLGVNDVAESIESWQLGCIMFPPVNDVVKEEIDSLITDGLEENLIKDDPLLKLAEQDTTSSTPAEDGRTRNGESGNVGRRNNGDEPDISSIQLTTPKESLSKTVRKSSIGRPKSGMRTTIVRLARIDPSSHKFQSGIDRIGNPVYKDDFTIDCDRQDRRSVVAGSPKYDGCDQEVSKSDDSIPSTMSSHAELALTTKSSNRFPEVKSYRSTRQAANVARDNFASMEDDTEENQVVDLSPRPKKGLRKAQIDNLSGCSKEQSNFQTMDKEKIEEIFPNPRDRAQIGRKRVRNKVDQSQANENSWHHASAHSQSFIGKLVPYGNRTTSEPSTQNDAKRIEGEIQGNLIDCNLRIKLGENDEFDNVNCRSNAKFIWCPFCAKKIPNPKARYTLGDHFFRHHNYIWIDQAMVCDLCDYLCFTKSSLFHHLVNFHDAQLSDAVLKEHCRTCGINHRGRTCTFGMSNTAKVYAYPKRLFTCETCGKSCANARSLENHMCKDHGAPYRFTCSQEGCVFNTNTRDYLSNHLFMKHRISLGDRPVLTCANCDFCTTNASSMKKHELNHTALDYSFKCTHSGCSKSFRQLKHLKGHIYNFHSSFELSCPHCPSVFSTHVKLRRHVKLMHKERIRKFKCAYCSHATFSKGNCRTHIKNRHKGQPVDVVVLQEGSSA